MSVSQVKCYLLPKYDSKSIDKPIEIKRFTFNHSNAVNAYENLLSEILSHFSEYFKTANEIKTFWLDSENELIKFSTNDEFFNFVSYSTGKDKLLRIYLVKQVEVKSEPLSNELPNLFETMSSILNNPEVMVNIRNVMESFTNTFEKELSSVNTPPAPSKCDNKDKSESFKLGEKELDQRVKVALENLRKMGYSNENGCLEKLLRENQGNINPVLDIIKIY